MSARTGRYRKTVDPSDSLMFYSARMQYLTKPGSATHHRRPLSGSMLPNSHQMTLQPPHEFLTRRQARAMVRSKSTLTGLDHEHHRLNRRRPATAPHPSNVEPKKSLKAIVMMTKQWGQQAAEEVQHQAMLRERKPRKRAIYVEQTWECRQAAGCLFWQNLGTGECREDPPTPRNSYGRPAPHGSEEAAPTSPKAEPGARISIMKLQHFDRQGNLVPMDEHDSNRLATQKPADKSASSELQDKPTSLPPRSPSRARDLRRSSSEPRGESDVPARSSVHRRSAGEGPLNGAIAGGVPKPALADNPDVKALAVLKVLEKSPEPLGTGSMVYSSAPINELLDMLSKEESRRRSAKMKRPKTATSRAV